MSAVHAAILPMEVATTVAAMSGGGTLRTSPVAVVTARVSPTVSAAPSVDPPWRHWSAAYGASVG